MNKLSKRIESNFSISKCLKFFLSREKLAGVKVIACRDSIRGRLLLYFMRDKTQINQQSERAENKTAQEHEIESEIR